MKKKEYVKKVFEELESRGLSHDEAVQIVGKTRFMDVMKAFPKEQMALSVQKTADEIILIASTR